MKELIIITIFFSITLQVIHCQTTTFEYLYSTPQSEIVRDIYEASNGDIFVCGYTTAPDSFWGKANGLVFKIDNEGNFIDQAVFSQQDRRCVLINILPDSNQNMILCGNSSDTVMQQGNSFENARLEIKRINSSLNVLSEKSYKLPDDYRYQYMISRNGRNNDILIGGSFVPEYFTPYLFFYIIDNQFDSIRATYYTDKNRSCYALNQLNDSTYWIADGSGPHYYILDSILQITDYLYSMPHWINEPFGIKWDSDTSFYLAGEWNGGPDNDIGFFKQFHPIDSTGNLFNTWGTPDTLDIPAADALDYKNKDSIFIGGTTNYWYYNTPTSSWYFIIQTDSNLNVRWERFYGGDARYTMWKIIASNDGGCIIAGIRYDYENASVEEMDIHILKLNSEGLLVKSLEHPGIEMHEAIVYPNPGTNQIRLRIASQYRHSTFEMFDINGKLVISKRISGKWGEINTEHLSSGTYIYRIYSLEGLSESGKWIKQ